MGVNGGSVPRGVRGNLAFGGAAYPAQWIILKQPIDGPGLRYLCAHEFVWTLIEQDGCRTAGGPG